MAKIDEIIKRLEKLKRLKIKAGILKVATYPDTGMSVAQVAIWQEFGTSTIPPRPFMLNTVREKRKFWLDGFGKLMQAYLEGRITLDVIGDKMGVAMKTGILETIDSNVPPPNSRKTLARKIKRGTANPTTLVDSGTLRDSISYEYET